LCPEDIHVSLNVILRRVLHAAQAIVTVRLPAARCYIIEIPLPVITDSHRPVQCGRLQQVCSFATRSSIFTAIPHPRELAHYSTGFHFDSVSFVCLLLIGCGYIRR
jgi:hypothetical protein